MLQRSRRSVIWRREEREVGDVCERADAAMIKRFPLLQWQARVQSEIPERKNKRKSFGQAGGGGGQESSEDGSINEVSGTYRCAHFRKNFRSGGRREIWGDFLHSI